MRHHKLGHKLGLLVMRDDMVIVVYWAVLVMRHHKLGHKLGLLVMRDDMVIVVYWAVLVMRHHKLSLFVMLLDHNVVMRDHKEFLLYRTKYLMLMDRNEIQLEVIEKY